jgi:predicted Abi (CAAX) family protease
MSILLERFTQACFTVPTLNNWLWAIALLVAYTAIAIPIGQTLGFLQIEVISSGKIALKMSAIAFFMPGVLEELGWRVAFIPHPTEAVSHWKLLLWTSLSLSLFVLYHPLNRCVPHNTFKNPIFLGLATLLGLVCSISYLESGSLWTPVFLHWSIVVGWLVFFGGYQKVNS